MMKMLMTIALFLFVVAAYAWEGEGTLINPYKITTISDLVQLKTNVTNGNAYEGAYFKVTQSFTLTSDAIPRGSIEEGIYCGGSGTESNPFLICDYPSLCKMRDNINAGIHSSSYFKLVNDVEMPAQVDGVDLNWIPIGYNGPVFSGSFNGNGRTISGLRINNSTTDSIGFFGVSLGATIKNLVLKTRGEGIISTKNCIGTLIGHQLGGLVEKCIVWTNMDINGTNVGGLVGKQENAEVTQSYVFANITSNNSNAQRLGGMIGYQRGKLSNSFVRVNITAHNIHVGALAGYINNNMVNPAYSFIKNCFSEGNIFTNNIEGVTYPTRTGGISGYVNSPEPKLINNISMLDTIMTETPKSHTGRIAGFFNFAASTISNNYANGNMVFTTSDPGYTLDPRRDGTGWDPADFHTSSFYTNPGYWLDEVWNIAANNDNTKAWNIWEDNTHPYIQGQSAPVVITRIRTNRIEGIFRNTTGDIGNDKVVIYRLNTGGDLEEIGLATLTAATPDPVWKFSGTAAGATDKLFAVYYEEGKLPAPLVPIPDRKSVWYRSASDGSFETTIWQQSQDKGLTWSEISSPVAFNPLVAEKVIVRGDIVLQNQAGRFTVDTFRVETGGKMNFTNGYLAINALEMISDVETNRGGQFLWTKTNDAPDFSGTLRFSNMKVIKTNFKKGYWFHVAMPFDVAEVRDTFHTVLEYNTDYYAMPYDGALRAKNDSHDTNVGINWVDFEGKEQMTANAGCQIARPRLNGEEPGTLSNLMFISGTGSDQLISASMKKDITIPVIPHNDGGTSPVNTGWNLIGNPYTSSFNLKNLSPGHICYLYEPSNRSYQVVNTETDYWLEPYQAFFIQTEGNSLTFKQEGADLRNSTPPAYDEVKIQFSNQSFSDEFRINFRENATTGYDLNKDAVKMISKYAPQIYSTSGSLNYAIYALPYPDKGQRMVIPLTYFTPAAGNYTLSYSPTGKPEQLAQLQLRDKSAGESVDLLHNQSFSFAATKSETNAARFELIIELKPVITSLPGIENSTVKLIAGDKSFYFEGLEHESEVSLYDFSGNRVLKYSGVKNNQMITNGLNGFYIVKLQNNSQKIVRKIRLDKQ